MDTCLTDLVTHAESCWVLVAELIFTKGPPPCQGLRRAFGINPQCKPGRWVEVHCCQRRRLRHREGRQVA